jgi:hypothetical protein
MPPSTPRFSRNLNLVRVDSTSKFFTQIAAAPPSRPAQEFRYPVKKNGVSDIFTVFYSRITNLGLGTNILCSVRCAGSRSSESSAMQAAALLRCTVHLARSPLLHCRYRRAHVDPRKDVVLFFCRACFTLYSTASDMWAGLRSPTESSAVRIWRNEINSARGLSKCIDS